MVNSLKESVCRLALYTCAELVEVCRLEVLDASTLRHFDKLSASQAQCVAGSAQVPFSLTDC